MLIKNLYVNKTTVDPYQLKINIADTIFSTNSMPLLKLFVRIVVGSTQII